MKRRFKVIATAAVAVGLVGLASTGMAQQQSRDAVRAEGLSEALSDISQGCQEVASESSRGATAFPPGFLEQLSENCAGDTPQ